MLGVVFGVSWRFLPVEFALCLGVLTLHIQAYTQSRLITEERNLNASEWLNVVTLYTLCGMNIYNGEDGYAHRMLLAFMACDFIQNILVLRRFTFLDNIYPYVAEVVLLLPSGLETLTTNGEFDWYKIPMILGCVVALITTEAWFHLEQPAIEVDAASIESLVMGPRIEPRANLIEFEITPAVATLAIEAAPTAPPVVELPTVVVPVETPKVVPEVPVIVPPAPGSEFDFLVDYLNNPAPAKVLV